MRDLLYDPAAAFRIVPLAPTYRSSDRDKERGIPAHQGAVSGRVLSGGDVHAVSDRESSGAQQEPATEVAELQAGVARGVGSDAPHRRERRFTATAPARTQERGNRRILRQRGDANASLSGLKEIGENLGRERESLVGEGAGGLPDLTVADRKLRDRDRHQQNRHEQRQLAFDGPVHHASRTSRTLRVIASVVNGLAR